MVETQRIVEWLQRLVRIPSVGPRNPGPRSGAINEGQIAAQASAWFEALGGGVEREDVYPGRPNTYGVWHGQTDDRCPRPAMMMRFDAYSDFDRRIKLFPY
jgi:acetylornithine deacetylase/succinyl-diaminopimelate desuccinylase-like protein